MRDPTTGIWSILEERRISQLWVFLFSPSLRRRSRRGGTTEGPKGQVYLEKEQRRRDTRTRTEKKRNLPSTTLPDRKILDETTHPSCVATYVGRMETTQRFVPYHWVPFFMGIFVSLVRRIPVPFSLLFQRLPKRRLRKGQGKCKMPCMEVRRRPNLVTTPSSPVFLRFRLSVIIPDGSETLVIQFLG